jgi:hypothetical protein
MPPFSLLPSLTQHFFVSAACFCRDEARITEAAIKVRV